MVDRSLRAKMCRRYLVEVLEVDADDQVNISRLDMIPYRILIRPLVIIDSDNLSQRMLATRFQVTRKTIQYIQQLGRKWSTERTKTAQT